MNVPSTKSLESATKQGRSSVRVIQEALLNLYGATALADEFIAGAHPSSDAH